MSFYEEQDYTKNFDFNIWRKILVRLHNHRRSVGILLFTDIIIAAVDIAFALFTKYAIDVFVGQGDLTNLPGFIALYIVVFGLQVFNVYNFVHHAGKVEVGLVYDVRKEAFEKLQTLSLSYYDTTPVGWIMARLTTDAQRLGEVIAWSILDISWGFAITIMAFILMFILNGPLAAILLLVFPVLAFLSLFFQKRILQGHRLVRKFNSKITGAYNEGINGAQTSKTLVREEENHREFRKLSSGMRGAAVRTAIVSSIYMPIVMLIGNIGMALVLTSGGVQVLGGTIGLGTLSLFVSYSLLIFEPIQQTARIFSEVQSAQAAAERTLSLVEMTPEIVDAPEIAAHYGEPLRPKPVEERMKGDIVFDHLSFAYKTGEKVLDNFNLHVRPGEKIALVGETGGGKSTIVNLLCRFYEPVSGRILIDGVDYREKSQSWLHSQLGYVLQSPHLFSGSIMDNIRYGNLNAGDEDIYEAAKAVNAYEFIMGLPDKFDTQVGVDGSRLSSGQKQLISFARAIVADPALFILDEATSSVDTQTEHMIQEAINNALQGRTSFIIAHRLSTIRSCDRILVIDKGKIVEEGNHAALMHAKGRYYHLYTNQFIGLSEEWSG